MIIPPDITVENPLAWCHRCRRFHKYYTFTDEDLDRCISDATRQLAKDIDERVAAKLLRRFED